MTESLFFRHGRARKITSLKKVRHKVLPTWTYLLRSKLLRRSCSFEGAGTTEEVLQLLCTLQLDFEQQQVCVCVCAVHAVHCTHWLYYTIL